MIWHVKQFISFPNLLSLLRILLAPLMLLSALQGEKTIFLTLLSLAWISDWLDGLIARLTHQVSGFGSKLDSLGDFVVYVTLPVGIYLLWPEVIAEEGGFILAGLAAYLIAHLLAFVKFRQLASYHTWAAKITAILMAVSLLVMLGLGIHWMFQLAIICVILSAIESTLITFRLQSFRNDIPTYCHLMGKLRNRSDSHKNGKSS
ncbi:MAG: CDP-alcohol phosphatidyltransferase family protein [Candidatus Thiodiazotropha sp. (ex Myrtea spinifera)]|nr:CDP-alcohol phosphatidyltransferase family protein [Candidatus Thiodiazotropha sp. (ex Myrtea spinifera)]MCU7828257.1 CDP-alcohol phosphatidyltransferase family protein [Candidatus Thiodiazotropha sp. (ex Myrtea sp. 'scaly one' KF741663)]